MYLSEETDKELQSMRRPFPLLPVALIALLLAILCTNFWPKMFDKLHGKVHDLTGKVHDKLHIKDGHQQTQTPPPVPQDTKPKPENSFPGVPSRPNASENEVFAILRRRWLYQVLGDFNSLDFSDEVVKTKLAEISKNGKGLLDLYVKTPMTDRVFRNAGPLSATTVHVKNTYFRLLGMALAWATPGTDYYQNQEYLDKIIVGLDFNYKSVYHWDNPDIKKCLKSRENWWNLQIGAPMNLADICVILYDHLDIDRRRKWGETIVRIVGNTLIPSLKGGNRAWVSRVLIITGIFMDDGEVIRKGIGTMSAEGGNAEVKKGSLFGYIQPGEGEGMYEDGSVIAHHVYAYAGGYGLNMIKMIGGLLNLLNSDETPDPTYRVNDPKIDLIYESLERNFSPVVWHGIMFEHVRGRGVCLRSGPGWDAGHQLIHAAALLSNGTKDQATQSKIASMVRLWYYSNPKDALRVASTMPQIPILQSILNNQSVPQIPHPRGAFATPIQEHFVYYSTDKDASWCFTLSLSSTRVGRAECLNNQNIRSWYQGDGMTYLYTNTHKTHYGDDYWPTMDPLHVPGTTTHRIEPQMLEYRSMGYNDWSGGACWSGGGEGWGTGATFKSNGKGARVAAVSMDHLGVDKKSAGRKTWFMFEDTVIALGAGCSGSSNPPSNLHTTIEQRNMDQPGRLLVVDDIEHREPAGWMDQNPNAHWAWLENTAGYIFLDTSNPDLRASSQTPQLNKIFSRTQKCGKWKDIDGDGKLDDVCREYVDIILDHGVNPENSAYAYAMLPLASLETTREMARNQTWRIFENSVRLQALEVPFEGGNVIMATFWQPGEMNGIRVDKPCQLIWGRWGNRWCLTVSDPSWKTNTVVVHIGAIGSLKPGRKSWAVEVKGDAVTFGRLGSGQAKSVFFDGEPGHDEL
ncbi:Chondroitinase-AC [Arthrobotrys entomopaga]|nr:Chondroitinase-AC [Arthrobotrys entomopaga]